LEKLYCGISYDVDGVRSYRPTTAEAATRATSVTSEEKLVKEEEPLVVGAGVELLEESAVPDAGESSMVKSSVGVGVGAVVTSASTSSDREADPVLSLPPTLDKSPTAEAPRELLRDSVIFKSRSSLAAERLLVALLLDAVELLVAAEPSLPLELERKW